MNYIQSLREANNEKTATICAAVEELTNLMAYLQTSKFQGPDNDFVHIKTDLFPKLREIRMGLLR